MVLRKGNAKVKLYDIYGNVQDEVLSSAVYIPSYKQNIFSVSAAIDKEASITLDKDAKTFRAPNGIMFGIKKTTWAFILFE